MDTITMILFVTAIVMFALFTYFCGKAYKIAIKTERTPDEENSLKSILGSVKSLMILGTFTLLILFGVAIFLEQ